MIVMSFRTNLHYIFPKAQSLSAFVLCTVSILTSTAISVDRLLALSLGLRYRHVFTLLRRVRVVIICLWLLSLALGVWIWMQFDEDIITVTAFIVLITLWLLTSLFSYIKIYLRLRHYQNQSQPQVHQAQPLNGEQIELNIARYKRVVSSIAWVQLALLVCYLPFSITIMLALFDTITLQISVPFVLSFLYLNSSLNSMLYCWRIIQRSERSSEGHNQTIKLLCINLDLIEQRGRAPARYKTIRETKYTLCMFLRFCRYQ